MKAFMMLPAGASLIVAGQVFAQPPFQPPMGPFGRGGWSPWGGGATGDWITWLALIAGGSHAERESAVAILKMRHARGEIDSREFEERGRGLL